MADGDSLVLGNMTNDLNKALRSSDAISACRAIGEALRLYNVADVARKAGVERPSLYRAFNGERGPRFATVLSVLNAMGFEMRVVQKPTRKSRPRSRS